MSRFLKLVKKHYLLIILAIVAGLLVRYMFFSPVLPEGEEVLNKRTLTSRTYSNGDGSYRLEAYGSPIHFFDGRQYRPLDEAVEPDLEFKEFVLEAKPEELDLEKEFHLILYEKYDLDPAISVATEDGGQKLVFRDAKQDVLFGLNNSRSTDDQGREEQNGFQVIFSQDKTEVGFRIKRSFLEQASYPIHVSIEPLRP